MNKNVSFDIAKLLNSKDFDIKCLHFYTKPNSTMFGIDEHNKIYPIKNTSKKLYKEGEHAALNIKSVYSAPTISDVVMWLYEKYDIWISVSTSKYLKFYSRVFKKESTKSIEHSFIFEISGSIYDFNTPCEAYEAAIEYVLTNLI
jgi:hypothetical protein